MVVVGVARRLPWHGLFLLVGAAGQELNGVLVGGYHHTCTIVGNGQVKCWGGNDKGQLGLGDTKIRNSHNVPFVDLGAGRTAKSLAAGNAHTCAVLDNGMLKCWGDDSRKCCWGKLGLGNTTNRGHEAGSMGDKLPAVDLGKGRFAKTVVAGEQHTCAILDNGKLKCWGQNIQGQLGLGGTAARGTHALHMGDRLPYVDLGGNRTVTSLSGSLYHNCALLDKGQVKCWGHGKRGVLGYEDETDRGDHPNEMGELLMPINLGSNRTAKYLASACGGHTCVILDNDKVKCWGENENGQLGLGDKRPRGYRGGQMGDHLPFVDLGTGRTAKSLSTGHEHTCAVLDNGMVKCWGHNNVGQLGYGDKKNRGNSEGEMGEALPSVDLGAGRTAKSLVAGYHHTCALLDDSKIKCWGFNEGGQLGQGDRRNRGSSPGEMGDALLALKLKDGKSSEL